MQNWKQLPNVQISVPVRSAGNIVTNKPVDFAMYQCDLMYKAVPLCDTIQKGMAQLKEEVRFYFRQDKAVSVNGIMDGNQHIVERLGEILKAQDVAAD